MECLINRSSGRDNGVEIKLFTKEWPLLRINSCVQNKKAHKGRYPWQGSNLQNRNGLKIIMKILNNLRIVVYKTSNYGGYYCIYPSNLELNGFEKEEKPRLLLYAF